MKNQIKNISLLIVVALIVVSIWYLESKKPPSLNSGAADIVLPATSTTPSVLSASGTDRSSIRAEKSIKYSRAKELVDPTGFINTGPFKLSDIVGKKVVLLDFWTYSCINCQRTIPYLNAWYQKYRDLGLVIVGVHTPEFDFEKDYNNVSTATKGRGIQYPVVLDSNHGTWNAYQNIYWPREYLIDIDGFIVHDSIGEGHYEADERAIQAALKERSDGLGLGLNIPNTISSPQNVISMDASKVQSPEIYFGAEGNNYLSNGDKGVMGEQNLSLPNSFSLNALYLGGDWNFQNEYAQNKTTEGKIVFKYSAKNVYMVASADQTVKLKIMVDGKFLKEITVLDDRLYDLIGGDSYGEHLLEIEVENPGLKAFTFTFG